MGEYADMAIDDGFAEWEAVERAIADGDYEQDDASMPGVQFPRFRGRLPSRAASPCHGCGKGGLYWLAIDGKWRLHHYTMFGGMTRPGYSLHRCGFASDGSELSSGGAGNTADPDRIRPEGPRAAQVADDASGRTPK